VKRCGNTLLTFPLVSTVSTRGVVVPNVVVGPAMWYGGLAQLLAGSESLDLNGSPITVSFKFNPCSIID